MPKMNKNIARIAIAFIIPANATPNALIDILNPWFLEINLSGRITFINLKTLIALRLDEVTIYDANYNKINH